MVQIPPQAPCPVQSFRPVQKHRPCLLSRQGRILLDPVGELQSVPFQLIMANAFLKYICVYVCVYIYM